MQRSSSSSGLSLSSYSCLCNVLLFGNIQVPQVLVRFTLNSHVLVWCLNEVQELVFLVDHLKLR